MPSGSCPSSNLLNIISGLLLIVAIEDAVFLRSPVFGDGNGGYVVCSLGAEVFRESHENGLVNFLVGGGAGGGRLVCEVGAVGGGDQGTDGRTPESPWRAVFVVFAGGLGGGSGLVESRNACV